MQPLFVSLLVIKRHFPRNLLHVGVRITKMTNRKRWGPGGRNTYPRGPSIARPRYDALRGWASGPKRWQSLVRHPVELLRGQLSVLFRSPYGQKCERALYCFSVPIFWLQMVFSITLVDG